jgi:hypothetical protein
MEPCCIWALHTGCRQVRQGLQGRGSHAEAVIMQLLCRAMHARASTINFTCNNAGSSAVPAAGSVMCSTANRCRL